MTNPLPSSLETLNSDHLTVFCKVAETLNFSRAAAGLNIAQPLVTRRIKLLEEQLGVELFVRTNRGCKLTASGELLLSRAKGVLLQLSQMTQEVKHLGHVVSGPISIGVTASTAPFLAPRLVSLLRGQWPQLAVTMFEAPSRVLLGSVLNRDLSIALFYDPPSDPRLVATQVIIERLHLVGVRDLLPSTMTTATLHDLTTLPLVLTSHVNAIRSVLDDAAAEAGWKLKPVFEANSAILLKALVEQRLGCTVCALGTVADEVASGKLVAVPLIDKGLAMGLAIVHHVEQHQSRVVRMVIDRITAEIRHMVNLGIWPGSPQLVDQSSMPASPSARPLTALAEFAAGKPA